MSLAGGTAADLVDLLHAKPPSIGSGPPDYVKLQEVLATYTLRLRTATASNPTDNSSSPPAADAVDDLLQDVLQSGLYAAISQRVRVVLAQPPSTGGADSTVATLVTAATEVLSFAADALPQHPETAKSLLASCLEVNINPAQSPIPTLLSATSSLSDTTLAAAGEQLFSTAAAAARALYWADAPNGTPLKGSASSQDKAVQGSASLQHKSVQEPASSQDSSADSGNSNQQAARLQQLVSLALIMLDTAVHLPQPLGAAAAAAAVGAVAAADAASAAGGVASLSLASGSGSGSAVVEPQSKSGSGVGSSAAPASAEAHRVVEAGIVQGLQLLQVLAAPVAYTLPEAASSDTFQAPPEPSAASEAASEAVATQRSLALLEAVGGPGKLMSLLEGVLLSGGAVAPRHQAAASLLRELAEHEQVRQQLYSAPAALLSLCTTYRKYIQHHTSPTPASASSATAATAATAAAPAGAALAVMQQLATSESKGSSNPNPNPNAAGGSNGTATGSSAAGTAVTGVTVAGLSEVQLLMLYRLSMDILRCVSLNEPSEEEGTLPALLPVLCGLAQLLAVTAEPAAVAFASLGGIIASAADKFAYLAAFMMHFGDGVMYRSAAMRMADGLAAATTFAASVSTDAEWPLPLHIMKLMIVLSQGAINPVAAALYRHAGFMDAAANFAEAYRSRVDEVAAFDPGVVAFVQRMGQAGVESTRLMQVVLRSLIEFGSPTNKQAAARIAEVLSLCHLSGPPLGCWSLGCTNLAGVFGSNSASYSRCGACRVAAYCSSDCQRKDWAGPNGHKMQCKRVQPQPQTSS